jgi:hypothetical protein
MASFNAFLYDTYEAAQSALQQCDDYYGFPIEGTHTTAEIEPYNEQFFIRADEMTINVLGENFITLANDENGATE